MRVGFILQVGEELLSYSELTQVFPEYLFI